MTDINMDKFGVVMGGQHIRVFSEKRRIDVASVQPVVVFEIGFTLEQLIDVESGVESISEFGEMILNEITLSRMDKELKGI